MPYRNGNVKFKGSANFFEEGEIQNSVFSVSAHSLALGVCKMSERSDENGARTTFCAKVTWPQWKMHCSICNERTNTAMESDNKNSSTLSVIGVAPSAVLPEAVYPRAGPPTRQQQRNIREIRPKR